MSFSMLLLGLTVLLKISARINPAVRKKAGEKNFVIAIQTADGVRGRYFRFSGGGIGSGRTGREKADVSLIWKDASTGFNVMIKLSDNAFVKALQNGSLRIEGDLNLLPGFMNIVRTAMKPVR
ncbi:MAG: hypothetical protein JW807_11050 [Spirochaetes bacterium]|nr:hypothetical protein [Spirochaetota bacterium]